MAATKHNLRSSQREAVLEHLFVGEVLRHLWLRDLTAEVLRPEVDDAGYDLVIECNSIVRHIQLKASHVGSTTARVPVNVRLEQKPSGCIIWIAFDKKTLDLCAFRWFGGDPGKPLPSLKGAAVAKHSKANTDGVKGFRPNVRILPKGRFTVITDMLSLTQELFGRVVQDQPG